MDMRKDPLGYRKIPEEQPKEIHHPEFIILDDSQEYMQRERGGSRRSEYFTVLQQLNGIKHGWSVRLIAFATFLFMLLSSAFVCVLFVVALVFAGLAFYQSAELNKRLRKSWKNVKKMLAISLGLFLAILSPAFGFGVIILYLMLNHENIQQTFFTQVFKDHIPTNEEE